jgi:hypothetical protein
MNALGVIIPKQGHLGHVRRVIIISNINLNRRVIIPLASCYDATQMIFTRITRVYGTEVDHWERFNPEQKFIFNKSIYEICCVGVMYSGE